MIKTEMQIERDFYAFVKGSTLGQSIRGDVYRSEMRPADAKGEDLIIKFLTGIDAQIQSGVVILNIYVPDVAYGKNGRMVADKKRIGELQELVLDFIATQGGTEYWIESQSTPTTYYNEDIEQHLIAARIEFRRITN